MSYQPDPDNKPRLVGCTDWEYVYRPKGLRRLYRRPIIKYTHGFTYWYKGHTPITIEPGDESDSFSIPWPFVVASLLYFDYVMDEITWASGVHDDVCASMEFDPGTRADIFRESIWLAFEILKKKIKREESGWITRKVRITMAFIRNLLLVGAVKFGSVTLGTC